MNNSKKDKRPLKPDLFSIFDSSEYFVSTIVAQRINNVNKIIGSATCILPGVFITARHVAEQWNIDAGIKIDDYDNSSNTDVTYNVDVLQICKETEPIVWHLTKVYYVNNSDLAILVAHRYEGNYGTVLQAIRPTPTMHVNLHMPKIDDAVISLGYPATTNDSIEGTKTLHRMRLIRSEGVVEDVGFTGIGLIKAASFQANTAISGGMSGGPTMDAMGRLIGINSSSFEPNEHNNSYTSFVSLLWNAFNIKFELTFDDAPADTQKISLFELCKRGILVADGIEHFEVSDIGFTYRSIAPSCKSCNSSVTISS